MHCAGRPTLCPIHFGPTCFRPIQNLIGLDEMDWTEKVGRKKVGRKLDARIVLQDKLHFDKTSTNIDSNSTARKLNNRSYPIQFEWKLKYSFICA